MTPSRRSALLSTAAGLAASLAQRLHAADTASKGNVNHSVCKWCYPRVPLDELCEAGKKFGLSSIELLGPADWPTVAKHGITCAMATNPTVDGLGGIPKAFNRVEHHDKLVAAYEDYIPKAAAAGLKNVICFSGNRDGLADDKGIENCAQGVKRLMSACEKNKVTLVMELLNSKVNHKDYQCDKTEWGVELCRRVGSENFKLLYDIYHMQIMEGDVIATIKKYHAYIAHYHTGGVPGRHEIDETQELHYPAIMKAIVETGYKGFVGQEFIPAREDKFASLAQGVKICDV
ncbi:MAG: TIM barrel protein [Acidobacteria bacterium]|nr:TIM barrel protein [Acidobacteriota bacterium]